MSRAKSFLSKPSNWILDLLYPRACLICHKSLSIHPLIFLCNSCESTISMIKKPYCHVCGRPFFLSEYEIQDNIVCGDCQEKRYAFNGARSVFLYEQDKVLSQLIIALKRSQKLVVYHVFNRILNTFAPKICPWQKVNMIIPIPLHFSRLGQRGFNQSAFLASILGRNWGVLVCHDLLIRIRNTPFQTGNREHRINNVRNAFLVQNAREIVGKTIVLIDDVFASLK